LIRRLVDEVVVVEDEEIVEAMKLLWVHAKLVVEPAGAAPVAALLRGTVHAATTVAVLSGGNIACPWSLKDGALWPE
jgi:threonine dehydratase